MDLTKGLSAGLICLAVFSVPALAHAPLHQNKKKVKSHTVKIIHRPHRWIPRAQFTLYPGSLKKNIQRIANDFGWRVVIWKLQNDYRWVGKTRITGKSLPAVLAEILQDFPVQAIFYRGNHILLIAPRTIK